MEERLDPAAARRILDKMILDDPGLRDEVLAALKEQVTSQQLLVAANLKYWRGESGLTQRALAKATGMTQANICRIERTGKCNLGTLCLIAAVLKIDIVCFFNQLPEDA